MITCPDCGSTDYSIISGDLTTSDKTDFCCLNCGYVFFIFNGKIYTERDLAKFEEERQNESRGSVRKNQFAALYER
jgi:transposase-like protein